MKKIFVLMLTFLMTLSLATAAMAGDVKVGGELDLWTEFGDGVDHDNEFAATTKLKLTQDVSEMVSWGITIKYEWTGDSWSDTNKLKLDDAFLKFNTKPVALKIGRFETPFDLKHAYFCDDDSSAYKTKDFYRERNTFGIEGSGKINDNFTLTGVIFATEETSSADSETHFGIKGLYKKDNLNVVGSVYSMHEDSTAFLIQGTYKMDMFAINAMFNTHDLDNVDQNIFSIGASYGNEKFVAFIEDYIYDGDGIDDNMVKLGLKYYPAMKVQVYLNYFLYDENSDNDKAMLGFKVEF